MMAGALSNSHHSRLREAFRVIKLGIGHRIHHSEPFLDARATLMEIKARHARKLIHDVGEGAHLEDCLELFAHVAQRPLARSEALHHLRRLLLKVHVGGLHLLHEASNVTLPKHARDERARLELLKVFDVLTRSDVCNRRASCSHGGEGTTTLGVAVQLRNDDRANGHLLFEGDRLLVSRLTNGRVHDEDDFIRLYGIADLLHLLEERCLLHVAARGVYNDDLVCLLLELGHAFGSDLRRISFGVRAVERYLGFGAVLLQLVEGARTEGVGAHERTLEALALVHVRVFGACGGLAGSLQPDEHDDVGALLLRLVRLLARVEHAAQLVAHRLLEHLAFIHPRREGLYIHLLLH
mmetsp:Transcript_2630/g.8188  ORF Transcript_2630/g.8188 Transcript_2630/m.8188 type:complete len:352 (+) Transcript_2630:767-1822(+)